MGVRAIGAHRVRPRRVQRVQLEDRNPEALSLDVPLLSAQSPAPQVDPTAYSGGDGWRDRFSDFLKSQVGQLLGSGSLPELQRGVAEQLTGLAMPPTHGGQMSAPRVAGYVEGAWVLGRPLSLADLGVGGVGGMMMLPFPGLGAADDVARPVVKMGRGVTEDALRGMREALKRADSGSLASFWDEAKAGRIRSGIPVRGEQHELWSVAESAQNHVGMGRLAGYSEADIKRWYLHNAIADSLSNPGVMTEFDGMTGLKRGNVVASNQERVESVSSAVLARARAQYERDLFSWDKTVDAAQATSQVAKVADAAAGRSKWFRTEADPRLNLLDDPSLPPRGSDYYRDSDGAVSRYKTKETAAQTLKADEWGWMPTAEIVVYLDPVALGAMQDHVASFRWIDGKLTVVSADGGSVVGRVSDMPDVGLHPVSNFADGRTHVGDRIVEVFG